MRCARAALGRGATILAPSGALLIAGCEGNGDEVTADCGDSVVDGSKRISYAVTEEREPSR